MKATIYHNPRCSKSRQTLAILEDKGIDIEIIEYLQALEKQQKIRSEVLILPSNETHNIHQITYRHLNQNKTIVAFELIDIRFN